MPVPEPLLGGGAGRPRQHALPRRRNDGVDLVAQGCETIAELPPTGSQRHSGAPATGGPVRRPDRRALRSRGPSSCSSRRSRSSTSRPSGWPIPVWDGCHPYDNVPVQFSCHRQATDGSHRPPRVDRGRPRRSPPRAGAATRRGLPRRQDQSWPTTPASSDGASRCSPWPHPTCATDLQRIAARLADPLPVVREHVYHPAFGGSFSLKAVLPALVPGPGYDELEIAEGATASVALERLMFARRGACRPPRGPPARGAAPLLRARHDEHGEAARPAAGAGGESTMTSNGSTSPQPDSEAGSAACEASFRCRS